MGVVAKMQRIRDFWHRWFMGLRKKNNRMSKKYVEELTHPNYKKREKQVLFGQILRFPGMVEMKRETVSLILLYQLVILVKTEQKSQIKDKSKKNRA